MARTAIIIIFVMMFVAALWGVILTRRLQPYMDSRSWTVRRWAFIFLAIAQFHGIKKTVWSDHHFNWEDLAYFAELFVVYCGLNIANWLLLKDWRRFPLFQKSVTKGKKD
jgi:hypothetical protein